MSKIIVLDAGHGGSDPGAVKNGLREKDLTLSIVKKIQKYLNDNYTGHSVKLTRSTDKYLSLSERARLANNWKADLFISVHINAGGGTGYEDFIHNSLSNSSTTAKMRDTFHKEVVKEQSFWRNRGKKKANFAVLRETKMASILTENGFIDTKTDADKLKSNSYLDKIAKSHTEGIAKALNLKKKSTSSTNNKPQTPSSNTYKVVTNLVGYKTAADAKNRKNKATTVKAGTYYIYKQHDGMLNITKTKYVPGSWINPADNTNATIKVGSVVKVKKGAKSYEGKVVSAFVYNSEYKVDEIKGNRAVLDRKGICTAFHIKDLILVK